MKSKELDVRGSSELNTIVGKGSVIDGNMNVQNSVRVDGLVKGNITATEIVMVGKEGEVQGIIAAKHVMLAGKVKGHIKANGKVYFESRASVIGNVTASRLVVDDGALFDGKCIMKSSDNAIDKKNPVG